MSLANPETLEREIRPFRDIGDNYPKTIITFDRYILDDIDGIRVVNIRDWLMGRREPSIRILPIPRPTAVHGCAILI